MEFHQLAYVDAVARHLNFTRAAEELSIAQPSLSQQIKKLEAELGIRIFDRAERKVALTYEGRIFLAHARRILRHLGETREAVDDLVGLKRGEVRVGAPPAIATQYLPHLVAEFTRAYPGIGVQFKEAGALSVVEAVERGVVDMGFTALPVDETRFRKVSLFKDEMVILTPLGHPLALKGKGSLEEAAKEPLILLTEGFVLRQIILDLFAKRGLTPQIAYETSQHSVIRELVKHGLGISFIYRELLRPVQDEGTVMVEIDPKPTMREFGLIWKKDGYISRASRALLKFVTHSWSKVKRD